MDDPSKYFATPAVNLIWAMKESLQIIMDEGLENRFARHDKQGAATVSYTHLAPTVKPSPAMTSR